MPNEDELEELREEKMEQLKEQQQQEVEEESMQAQQEQADAQKQAILRQYLTDGARKRLNTVKMSKPDHGEQIERQILALAQSGRVQDQIDEDQMRELLSELTPDSKSFNIRRR